MDITNLNRDRKQKRKSSPDLSTMVYGKLPPQAKDLEEVVLGAMMIEKNAIDVVADFLTPEVFYVQAHQLIFSAIMRLSHKMQPIDTLTTIEELRKSGDLEIVGGPYYVTTLTNSIVSSANIERHSKILLEKFVQREIIRVGGEMIGEAYEDGTDAFELLDNVEEAIFSVTKRLQRNKFEPTDSLLVKAMQQIETIRHQQDQLTGIASGFHSVDQLTHGWQDTDLIIIAARPSVGKTAFALNLGRNAAMDLHKPTPTAIFSLEMSSGQLIRRLMSSESEINLKDISRGRLDDEKMQVLYSKAIQKLANIPLFIDDTPGLNIFELRAKARRMKSKHNIGLFIIDYIQLMSGTRDDRRGNREQEISSISRGLKGLAKELNVPIIALSQLSRETEKRADKNPQLADLRESGAIEQDADVVVFLYRPEYYGIHHDSMGQSNPGETHVKFAKHRNGTLETIKLKAQLWIQKFVEMEETKINGTDQKKEGWKPVETKLVQVGDKLKDEDPF